MRQNRHGNREAPVAFGNGRSGRRLSLRKVGRREAPDADFLNSAFEQQAVRNGMAGLSKELTTVHARKRFFNPGAVADKQLRYTSGISMRRQNHLKTLVRQHAQPDSLGPAADANAVRRYIKG